MGITYGDHLIDSGYYDITPEQEREIEINRLRAALGQIAGKNDLSGIPDDDLESAARNALYECELIAREALNDGCVLSERERK